MPEPSRLFPEALEQQDGTWRVEINGRTTTVDHVVGMQYVAALVAQPDKDVPAAELSRWPSPASISGGPRWTHPRSTRARGP